MSNIYIPEELIRYILDLTKIRCHICYKKIDINFYKKLNKLYFCSLECYNFN